jgi:dTDP-4-dehydrorhamnose 3,5-epimerase-like enzyme
VKIEYIHGDTFSDQRGSVHFVNDFDMTPVVRMYTIQPMLGIIRAWQGHCNEQKWFYALAGDFTIKVAKVTDWITPDIILKQTFYLQANSPAVLHIPAGYINGLQALSPHSSLLVFSDFTLAESKMDDIRWDVEKLPWESF